MKIWAFCVFMPQKLQDMSSFLGFGGNSALLRLKVIAIDLDRELCEIAADWEVPVDVLNSFC